MAEEIEEALSRGDFEKVKELTVGVKTSADFFDYKWVSDTYDNGKHLLGSFANKWAKDLSWDEVVKGTAKRNGFIEERGKRF
ncbi:MAG: hypothetical protein IT222_01530 [Crocinitomix sp.]|nr:hypothetical protein [Crocinitomix sp.]